MSPYELTCRSDGAKLQEHSCEMGGERASACPGMGRLGDGVRESGGGAVSSKEV